MEAALPIFCEHAAFHKSQMITNHIFQGLVASTNNDPENGAGSWQIDAKTGNFQGETVGLLQVWRAVEACHKTSLIFFLKTHISYYLAAMS